MCILSRSFCAIDEVVALTDGLKSPLGCIDADRIVMRRCLAIAGGEEPAPRRIRAMAQVRPVVRKNSVRGASAVHLMTGMQDSEQSVNNLLPNTKEHRLSGVR